MVGPVSARNSIHNEQGFSRDSTGCVIHAGRRQSSALHFLQITSLGRESLGNTRVSGTSVSERDELATRIPLGVGHNMVLEALSRVPIACFLPNKALGRAVD